MPPFRPWIGMNQVDPRHRILRQPYKQVYNVIEMQPDVLQLAAFDGRERLGHAVDERLDADEAGARPRLRLGDQIFAAAEADLELNVVGGERKQHSERGGRGVAEIDGEPRQ